MSLWGCTSLLQAYGFDPLDLRYPSNTTRSTSTMGNAILAGAVLLMTIPVTLVAAAITLREPMKTPGFWWKLLVWALAWAAQLLGIIFTDSRGPWFGTILALAGLLGLVFVFLNWRSFARIGLVLGLSLLLTAAVFFLSDRPHAKTGGGTDSEESAVTEFLTSAASGITGRGLSGRIEIWKNSWQLMVHRPWFKFDDLSMAPIRPLMGYGPETFRYAYLLESSPAGANLIPAGALHAHNYFIHQGVEIGFLGLLSSSGVFVALFLVGGYLLLRHRRNLDAVHLLILLGLLAIFAGRLLEQMVGLARISDLTVLWVLLALFAALPVAMQASPEAPDGAAVAEGRRSRRRHRPFSGVTLAQSVRVWPVLLVLVLASGIGYVTWVKTINYPRAALIAAEGVRQARQGDLQRALSSMDRSTGLAPDVWINYNRKVAVYSAFGRDDAVQTRPECYEDTDSVAYNICLARRVYQTSLDGARQRPYNYRTLQTLANSGLQLAVLSGDKQQEETTLRHFRELLDFVPAAWPLYNQLAAAQLRFGQPQKALDVLDQSLAITGDHPTSATAFFLAGVAYGNLGQPRQALEQFDASIRLDPTNSEVLNNRAMTFGTLGLAERALIDLGEALRYSPNYADAHSNRGLIYREFGQHQLAIDSLNEAIRLNPGHAQARVNRGLVFVDLGQYHRAIEDYDEAIRLDPGNVQAYLNRGVAHVDLGQGELAFQDAEAAIELSPMHPGAYALLAMAQTLLGRDTAAIEAKDRAVELGFAGPSLEKRIKELRDRR